MTTRPRADVELFTRRTKFSGVKFMKSSRSRGGSRGRVQGVRTPPPRDDLRFSNTTGILRKKKTMWFNVVEVERETSAPPPKKNPGSAPEDTVVLRIIAGSDYSIFHPKRG